MNRPSSEEGATTVLVAALLGVTALLAVGLGRLGGAAVTQARADAVADLTALAAVTGDAGGARRVAAAAGAAVLRIDAGPSGRRTVTVQLGPASAVAAAAPAADGQTVIPG